MSPEERNVVHKSVKVEVSCKDQRDATLVKCLTDFLCIQKETNVMQLNWWYCMEAEQVGV